VAQTAVRAGSQTPTTYPPAEAHGLWLAMPYVSAVLYPSRLS
jgi:hypothetical protein